MLLVAVILNLLFVKVTGHALKGRSALYVLLVKMSRNMRKPAFCICENKKAQISCAVTDHCLCFGHIIGSGGPRG